MVSSRSVSLRCPRRGMQRSSPTVYGCRGLSNTSRAGPCSTSSPAYSTPTRSHILAITARLWLMNNTEVRNSERSAATRSSTSASTVASSAVVGSSRISREGETASAMAMTARCAIPPDSSNGYRRMTRPGSEICTLRSMFSAEATASPDDWPAIWNTSAICRPTRSVGFSARPGSWYTIETVWARRSRSALLPIDSGSSPLMLIVPPLTRPLLGRYRTRASAAVDLPDPDSPTSP